MIRATTDNKPFTIHTQKARPAVGCTELLVAIKELRDECEASSRLIPAALDRDGGARHAFKTVAERLDSIIATND